MSFRTAISGIRAATATPRERAMAVQKAAGWSGPSTIVWS